MDPGKIAVFNENIYRVRLNIYIRIVCIVVRILLLCTFCIHYVGAYLVLFCSFFKSQVSQILCLLGLQQTIILLPTNLSRNIF